MRVPVFFKLCRLEGVSFDLCTQVSSKTTVSCSICSKEMIVLRNRPESALVKFQVSIIILGNLGRKTFFRPRKGVSSPNGDGGGDIHIYGITVRCGTYFV